MRLWHEALIPYLSNKRLCGQHRECCALRGKGWGRKHATVDYVFKYSKIKLYAYHCIVMKEMTRRGFNVNMNWLSSSYQGKNLERSFIMFDKHAYIDFTPYQEHDDKYLKECLELLDKKGEHIEWKQELK